MAPGFYGHKAVPPVGYSSRLFERMSVGMWPGH